MYLSLGGKSHHHHHHAGHFFSTKLPATCKKIASSESIKLVRGYSTARNDPWNVESLLSKDKERTDSKVVSSSCKFLCTTYHASEWFLIYLRYFTLPYLKVVLISSLISTLPSQPHTTTYMYVGGTNYLTGRALIISTIPPVSVSVSGTSSSRFYLLLYLYNNTPNPERPFCVYVPYLGGSM